MRPTGRVEGATKEPGDLALAWVMVLHRVEALVPRDVPSGLLGPKVRRPARVVQRLPELWVQLELLAGVRARFLLPCLLCHKARRRRGERSARQSHHPTCSAQQRCAHLAAQQQHQACPSHASQRQILFFG